MSRLRLTIAAVTVLAVAAIASTAIAAGGARQAPSGDEVATIIACLNEHGAQVPQDIDEARELKTWLGPRFEAEKAAAPALEACLPQAADKEIHSTAKPSEPAGSASKANGPSEADLAACLADQGLDVPEEGGDLKRWILSRIDDAAVADGLKMCGLAVAPAEDAAEGAAHRTAGKRATAK